MLMRWKIAVGLAIWLALLAWLTWYSSAQSPHNQQRPATEQTTDYQPEDSESSSITVWHWLADFWTWVTKDPVAFFTFALFCATAVLGIVGMAQIGFLIRADKTTRMAAKVAVDSSQALVIAERAHINLVIKNHNLREIMVAAHQYENSPETVLDSPRVQFSFRNYGKTPATIYEIHYGMALQIDDQPTDFAPSIQRIIETIGSGEETAPRSIEFYALPIGTAIEILRGQQKLWFFGRVKFASAFGSRHSMRWEATGHMYGFRLRLYEQYSENDPEK